MLEGATDNRNRTLSEIRHIFSKHGGNLGGSGCVSWMFSKKGYVVVPKEKADEEMLLNLVTEAGADDPRDDGSNWEVLAPPDKFPLEVDRLKAANIQTALAEVSLLPHASIKLTGKQAEHKLRPPPKLD